MGYVRIKHVLGLENVYPVNQPISWVYEVFSPGSLDVYGCSKEKTLTAKSRPRRTCRGLTQEIYLAHSVQQQKDVNH